MNQVIQAIKEHELSKEYLALTGAIADIDEQLKARVKRSFWQNETDLLSPKDRALLNAERMLLAKALMDVTARINGAADFEPSQAQIGISVDINLPAVPVENKCLPKSRSLRINH